MSSEVAELSSINDEDLLRRMWQQSEDFGRKKEIRAHMYKLREERLRNFYTGDMDGISMSKSPMVPSHGDSLADQSFQSFKAKEIRDSESPTRHMKYGPPDTSGWNVITSSEISSDGKEQINSTLATTDAIKDVPGGKSSFSGKNEQVDTHRHDGDDKNYKSTSGHTSNTVLKEHVVVGDADNGRTESTSNTTSSSTKIITSSKYHSDNIDNDDLVQEFEDVLSSAKRSVRENANKSNMKNEKFERIPCDDFDKECFNTSQSNSKTTNKSVNQSNQSNQQSTYEIRRNSLSSTTSSIDAKKIQKETEHLANAPGQLISRSVEYPDANTKVITETKTLPDGSTVTTTKYETRAASTSTSSRASKQEKSSSSRTITEDRAERNRIELIMGDNKNVVEEVLNTRHVIDNSRRPERKEITSDISVKQDIHRNANDRKDISHQKTSRQETSHQGNTRKETSHDENIRKETSHQEYTRKDDSRRPERKETVCDISVEQDVHRNANDRKDISHQKTSRQENSRQETSHQENTRKETSHQENTRRETSHEENSRQQNVNEDNIRRTHIQQHQINESRPTKVCEDHTQEKMHHENVFSKRVDENVSSHERSNIDNERNENLIKRVEVTINTEHPRDYNKKDRNAELSEIIDEKVSTDRHKTVKKDLSHDHEDYIQSRTYQDDQYDRQPVQEELIVPKKQVVHVCSPSHDHSVKPQPKPDYTSKRISVDHNASHEAFARSLRCVTPERDSKRSVQSSQQSVKSNYTYDHGRRSPSRDTNISDTSKFSTSTVTKSRKSYDTPHSPNRKPSPDKRKPTVENMSSAISSETIDIITSESEQKHSKRMESTTRKSSQNNISTKQTIIRKSEDHYDHPRNNQLVHPKSTTDDSPYYDIPRNNTPVQPQDGNLKISSDQPSYLRPTASSARHNTKLDCVDAATKSKKPTKENQEPIYETISDRPSNSRRQPHKTDSVPTYTSSVTKETEDYRTFKKSLRKQTAHQPDYEPEFDSGRSNSPTSSVSDIEYVNFSKNTRKVTDLDSEHSDVEKISTFKVTSKIEKRNEDTQDGLMFSTHKKKASSPSLESDTDTIIEHDDHPKEPFYLLDNQKEKTPVNDDKVRETRKEKPPLTRSETYEERCRTMLGMKAETDDIVNEQKNTTSSKTKNLKETSIDFIKSERNVDNVRRSVTISPDRKSVTNQLDKNTERSPSRSPDRKKPTFSKSSTEATSTKVTVETEDNRFDTFSLKKTKSPKRTPQSSPDRKENVQSKQPHTDQTSKNSSKTIHVKNSSPGRSVDSSPDRKEKSSDSVTELTTKFMQHEARSNSFTSRSNKTKDYVKDIKRTPSDKTPDLSPDRDSKLKSKPREYSSPKTSPTRSPNTSPIRKAPLPKETLVETTKKFMKSENHTEYISRKDSKNDISQKINKDKSPNRSPVRSRPINEKLQPEPDVEIVQSTKSSNKSIKTIDTSSKSPTREKKSYTTAGDTFAETKTDTIKRSPISPNKVSVDKANPIVTSDRKPMKPTDDNNRKLEDGNKKLGAKKPSHLAINTDNQDGAIISTNTFSRKKTKESIEVLSSPTKSKGKIPKTNPDTLSPTRPQATSVKLNSPTSKTSIENSKTKTKSIKVEVSTKRKPKCTNNFSTDDESENEPEIIVENIGVNPRNSKDSKYTKKVPIIERKDSAPVYRSTKVDKDVKMARSTSEHFSSPTRKRSKPEIETPKSPQKFEKRPTKCMTTKTINLSTTNTLNSEDMENVIIDIQQAKSSREPTPNRIIPTPVSPEEDTGKPRYPDTVHEPDDDAPKRRPNIKNIPILEEGTKEYISCHITEVSGDYDGNDSDECMLSVSDKVTKFSSTVTSPTKDKSYRRVVETVDESLESDECLLSVHDKVSKFIATAEEVNIPKSSKESRKQNSVTNTSSKVNEKVAQFTTTAEDVMKTKTSVPFKPEPVDDTDLIEDDCLLTVNDKVTKFLHTTDSVTKTVNKSDRVIRREFEDIDDDLKSDECLLSVHDKVNKFVTTAEKLTATVPQKSPELVAKIERQVSRRDKTTDIVDSQEISDHQYENVEEKQTRYNDTRKVTSKAKITDRYVPNKSKPSTPASVPITLQSIDVVKKAKSIFEKDDSPKVPKQRDILSRPSVWEDRRSKDAKVDVKLTDIGVYSKESSPEPRQPTRTPDEPRMSRTPDRVRTSHIYEQNSSKKDVFEKCVTPSRDQQYDYRKQTQKIDVYDTDSKSNYKSHKALVTDKNLTNEQTSKRKLFSEDRSSPDSNSNSRDDRSSSEKPSYMNHTVASLEHIRRDSIEINKTNIRKTTQEDEVDQIEINPRSSVKFGVELKRTNSQQSQPTRRKSSCSEIPHVEEIFELELLERMLETVVGYEQRRRIRAQIRLVKKQIQDEEIEILHKTTRNVKRSEIKTEISSRKHEPSPIRKSSPARKYNGDTGDHTSKNRTTSPVRKQSPNRKPIVIDEFSSSQRISHKEQSPARQSSPNKKHFIEEHSSSYRTESINHEIRKSRSPSPKSSKISMTSSNATNSELRQVSTTKTSDDDKPIWATKNILKKPSETARTFKTSSVGKKTTTVTKVQKQKTIEPNDDCVTSSYGIGPTDDDGKPLFGIRALKKKAGQTSKVTGTIVQETLYSENGASPTGNRTTTMYSSDPQDIRHFVETNGSASEIRDRLMERENSRRGMTSVTTSHKIGAKSPEDLALNVLGNKQAKVVRRGSVKELSEKFIQKESSKSSERTSSTYPKAGLILRTQTSRESTPGANSSLRSGSADFDDCDIELRTQDVIESDEEIEFRTSTSQRHQSHQTRSFLNNTSKVSGVQDVLNRMRNADNVAEDGDNEEDKEARALFNKFIGASVLMSGMESMVPREVATIVGKPASQKQVTTTRVTKTVKTTSSPSTTREIKIRDIDTIWDEELLKQLLDKSASYEERRKLRARLRQVMAEKEACADIVASVTAELKQQKLDEVKSKKMEVKQTKKEETEEEEEYEEVIEEYEEEVTDEDGEEEEEEEESEVDAIAEVKTANDSKIVTKEKQASTITASKTTTTATATKTSTAIASTKIDDKKEQSSQGESLLLPLLQGLLHKKTAQHSNTTKSPNKKQEHSVTHIEDSGTESGEDLKLLAAGLHDHMNKESTVPGIKSHRESIVQADLLAEVTTALNRLQATLRDGKDIDLDMNKRNALLTLVSRLQIGLVSPDKITDQPGPSGIVTSPEVESKVEIGRKSTGQGRFAKRRNRQIRHTVGVSQEELADARRYIEELLMMENLSNCGTPDNGTTPPEYNLSKPSSAGSVLSADHPVEPSVLFRPNQFLQNATSNGSDPNDTFVHMREKKPKHKFTRQSLSFEQQSDVTQTSRRPFSEALNFNQLSQQDDKQNSVIVIQNVMQKVGKFSKAAEMERPDYSSEDEHVLSRNAYNKIHHSNFGNKSQNTILNSMLKCRRSRTPPGKSIDENSSFNSKENKSTNRFTNKKLKMKRANTIDIPKASNYIGAHGSDNEDYENEFHESSIGLKGTVQPNAKVAPKKVVPTFKPKTENDHKFLAFLQKQNTSNGLTWTNPNRVPQPTNSHNWSNAFGNIVHTFQSKSEAVSNRKPPMAGLSSARNFWKQTENVKPTKTTTRNTLFSNILMKQNSLDEKSSSPNVVFGSLRIRDNVPVNGYSGNETNKFIVPKPVPINEFSHAPLSAFQPIQRKIEPPSFQPIPDPKFVPTINTVSQLTNGFHNITAQQNQSKPLPLTSPTRNLSNSFSPQNSQSKSPTSVLPWSNRIKADNRVLNLAASKFDVKSPPATNGKISPRSTSFRSFAPPQHLPNNTTGVRLQQKRGSLPNETSYSYFNEHDIPNLHQTQQNTQINENVSYNSPKLQPANYYAPSLPNLSNNPRDLKQYQPAPPLSTYKPENSYSNMQSSPQQLYYSQPPPPYTMPKSPSSYQSYPQSPPIYQSVKSPIQRNSNSFKQPKPPPSYPNTNRTYANDSPRSFGSESQRFDKSQQNNQTQSYRAPPPSYQQRPSTQQIPPMNYQPLPPTNYQPLPNTNYQQPHPPPSNYQQTHPLTNYQQPPPSYQSSIPNQVPSSSNYQSKPISYRPEAQQSNYDSPTTDFPAYPYTCTDYTQPACVSTYIPKVTVTMDPSDSLTNPSAEPIVLSNTRPIISPNNKPELLKIFDYPSSSENSPQSSVSPHTPHTLDDMDDDAELADMQEYTAKTQVMRGPVSQTAVTVSNKVTSRNGPNTHGKGSEAAMSLQSVLKNIKPKSPDARTEIINKYAKDVSDIAKRTFQSNPVNVQKILDAQPSHVKQSVIGNAKTVKTTSFKPPMIVETPSTPLAISKKPDFPSHVVYNNVSTGASTQECKVQVKSDQAVKTVTTTQSITSSVKAAPVKPISPFAKFRQLDKQVSTQSSPNSPSSPSTPKSTGGAPLFKFTDPVLSARAATVKDILLQWCQSKTKEYENVQITNFSTAWSDGLAFCALCHHFLPDSFDYSVLTPKQRRHNFTLAFRIMDEKAGIAPLLDVEDMVIMKKPDWKCVFTYVQSIHRRFRNVD